MGLFRTILKHTHKPEGVLGSCMVGLMNHGHASVADWGMKILPPEPGKRMVELGCGGGRNAKALLKNNPTAKLTAVDFSEISVQKTQKCNAQSIQSGRCTVVQADVSALPFSDGAFDLATAFETVYFWPGPLESFREVYRVLAPGGRFLIVNESDGAKATDARWASLIDDLVIYTEEELCSFLMEAGFGIERVEHDRAKHWLCILAVRE